VTVRHTVLVVSGNGPPVLDGVGHYTARLVAGLALARPEWRWVWLRRKRRWFTPPVAFENGVRVVQPWQRWDRTGIAAARAVVKFLRPAIVHVQEQTHSFHETPAAAAILRAARRTTIATVHEVHPELTGHRGTADLVRQARFVYTNDAVTADKCRDHIGRTPDGVLWSPANVLPPAWAVARRPGLVVTFGFLTAVKGMETLFAALVRVRESVPDLRWRIVGPFHPDADAHHALLKSRLRADWVEFTGGRDALDDRELRTWLAEASVMALPFVDGASARRGTLQTAWAFGLPVVTTPPTSVGETAVVSGDNCLTVPLDANEWADAIRDVLTDAALAARLAAGSRATGEGHGWGRLAADHLRIYDSALAAREEHRCG
jgi:glycosyltransferase involved in cell wall biosynthesis